MKIIHILLLLSLLCFYLEHSHSKTIENNNTNPVRINNANLSKNPFKELSRYVSDVNYYTPIWRISLIIATVITVIFYYYSSSANHPISEFNTALLALAAMFVVYHLFAYKKVHQYDFSSRSLQHILNKLSDNKLISKAAAKHLKDYKQITTKTCSL